MAQWVKRSTGPREVVCSISTTGFFFPFWKCCFSNIYIVLYILFVHFCKNLKYDKFWIPNHWQTEVTMKNYRENGAYPIARSLVQSPLREYFFHGRCCISWANIRIYKNISIIIKKKTGSFYIFLLTRSFIMPNIHLKKTCKFYHPPLQILISSISFPGFYVRYNAISRNPSARMGS